MAVYSKRGKLGEEARVELVRALEDSTFRQYTYRVYFP